MSSPIESGHASPHPLTQFGLLAVTGSDAESFLQGQTTCHVGHITPQQSGLGALCNLKGRVIANFTIVRTAQGFVLLLPLELLETVETRLRRYVMRSDVTLEAVTGQWSLFGLVGDASKALRTQYGIVLSNDNYAATTADGWIVINAPTADAERTLLMIRRDQAEAFWSAFKPNEAIDSCSDSQWLLEDIVSGIATITTATEELFVPQMINLDLLGGVSFDKGCYTGQEVVARMRFLGKLKRRLYLAETTAKRAPQMGDSLYPADGSSESERIGTVINAASSADDDPNHFKLLAAITISAAAQSEIALLSPGGDRLTLLPLPYPIASGE